MKENFKVTMLTASGLNEELDEEQIVGFVMMRLNLFYDDAKKLVALSLKNLKKSLGRR